MSPSAKQGFVIVGGGLAGLAAATVLQREDQDWILLEAGEKLGGRVASERHAGFILDRGFQVLNNAYPTIRKLVPLKQLQLAQFLPGARVYGGGKHRTVIDPRRAPGMALGVRPQGMATMGDAARLLGLLHEARVASSSGLNRIANVPTMDELRNRGFSRGFIDWFVRPFFAGVFLEPDLQTSWRSFITMFGYFASGMACLPRNGMGQIAASIAAELPGPRIRLNHPVIRLHHGAVESANGDITEFSKLILAVDLPAFEQLTNRLSGRRMRGVSCLYFAAVEAPYRQPLLSLAAAEESGPVATVAVLTNVQPAYSSDGRALISVSALGCPPTSQLTGDVLDQLEQWFGPVVREWELIGHHSIDQALPEQVPAYMQQTDVDPDLGHGVYCCGDHTTTPSIEGAARSGIRAAQRAIAGML